MSDRVYSKELDRHIPLGPDGETVVMFRDVAFEEHRTEAHLSAAVVVLTSSTRCELFRV